MSSKWGRSKSRLRIDGVTWPGASNSPPKGRPSKFKLRVVTIKEIPFVIYTKAQVRIYYTLLTKEGYQLKY